jgi:hypothetical protein
MVLYFPKIPGPVKEGIPGKIFFPVTGPFRQDQIQFLGAAKPGPFFPGAVPEEFSLPKLPVQVPALIPLLPGGEEIPFPEFYRGGKTPESFPGRVLPAVIPPRKEPLPPGQVGNKQRRRPFPDDRTGPPAGKPQEKFKVFFIAEKLLPILLRDAGDRHIPDQFSRLNQGVRRGFPLGGTEAEQGVDPGKGDGPFIAEPGAKLGGGFLLPGFGPFPVNH